MTVWRRRLPAVLLVTLAATACRAEDVSENAAGGESAPAVVAERPDYAVRLDSETSDQAEYRLSEDAEGLRVQTGPAGIAYHPDDAVVSGDFELTATFEQYDAPVGYREAFGLFVGGRDLEGPDQEYTYLLVRTTGDFLVKRRIGEITETLMDWTPSASVAVVAEAGDLPVNTLTIRVTEGETHFLVNGQEVFSAPATRVRPYGIAGLRVNHRLDVRVNGWALEATGT